MTVERLEVLRRSLLALTGASCVAYALLAIVQNKPDPLYWWVPMSFGIASAVLITAGFLMAGRDVAKQATDELYRATEVRASSRAYWVSLALFVLFAVLAGRDVLAWPTSVAAFGTLMGASYLVLFAYYDWRASQ